MKSPTRCAPRGIPLSVEQLEDRAVPASLDPGPAAEPAGRVNVVMAAEGRRAEDAAELAAAPVAARVDYLGFGIYSVTLADGVSAEKAVAYYSARPGVVAAEEDVLIYVEQVPNDTSYSSLYGMNRIGAPAAWDTFTGDPNFVVAVIDTGIDFNHPDLAANIWRNPNEIEGNGIDDDGNGYVDDIVGWDFANNDNNPFDDNGHGTHVAGTIGAVGNNARGVVGVNWSVDLMALKFLTASGSGSTSNAVRALDYATQMGVKVSNNSWGGGGGSALTAAIGRARAAGHIVVAAAGNSGVNIDTSPTFPASYSTSFDNVVTVAATDSADRLASFSNFGVNSVTLAAPGVSILSTSPGNRYATLSGTSMATPHVAGAIALFWAANPTLTYTQVINALKASVDPVAGLATRVQTGGRLNVARMFETVTAPPPAVAGGPVVTSAVFSGANPGQFSRVRVTFDRAVDAATFTAADVVLTRPNGTAVTVTGVTAVAGTGDTQFDITFAAQTALGTYQVVVGPDVRDAAGNRMNQDQDGVAGEAGEDAFTATDTLASSSFTVQSSGSARAIQDFQTTFWSINVTQAVRITDLNVRVSLTHTYLSDLTIRLRGPDGTSVLLFNRHGGSGDNLNGTVFNDEAGTAITSGAAPFAGSFRPFASLTAFDGRLSAGTWTLEVTDLEGGDVGSITSWSLSFIGVSGASPLSAAASAPPAAGGPAGPGVVGLFAFADAPAAAGGDGAFGFPADDEEAPLPLAEDVDTATAVAPVLFELPPSREGRPAGRPADLFLPVAGPEAFDPFADPLAPR